MRTDIFFTKTTKPICNFANSVIPAETPLEVVVSRNRETKFSFNTNNSISRTGSQDSSFKKMLYNVTCIKFLKFHKKETRAAPLIL